MMRRIFYVTIALFSLLQVRAQLSCEQAAIGLQAELLKTTSAKAQLKGKTRTAYNELSKDVFTAAAAIRDTTACFSLLTKLVAPLRDNHIFFSEKAATVLQNSVFADSSWIKEYRASPAFLHFPVVAIDLDSLEQALKKKGSQSQEGIYFQQRYQKVAVFTYPGNDTLQGVILETYMPNWEKGQLLFKLWQEAPGRYAVVQTNMIQKTLEYYRHIRFVNGDIPLLNLVRDLSRKNHADLPPGTPLFHFKKLTEETMYIRLGSFAVNYSITPQAKAFLSRIKDSLEGKNILVDLRNNGGGGFNTSRRFLKLLKKKARRHSIVLLMNYNTVSNAEQFIIRLKKKKNVFTLGQATRGMITYGSNRGLHTVIDKGPFRLYKTDMRGLGKDLHYEDTGVTPVVLLDNSKDWIEQALHYIESSK